LGRGCADDDQSRFHRAELSGLPRHEIDRRAGRQPELHHRQNRGGSLRHVPARSAAGAPPLHGDLGRRSHRRAPGHFHRTSAAPIRRPSTQSRGKRRRRADMGVRRSRIAQRRVQRGGRPTGVGVRVRAGPIR
jgi:hypothetical protein